MSQVSLGHAHDLWLWGVCMCVLLVLTSRGGGETAQGTVHGAASIGPDLLPSLLVCIVAMNAASVRECRSNQPLQAHSARTNCMNRRSRCRRSTWLAALHLLWRMRPLDRAGPTWLSLAIQLYHAPWRSVGQPGSLIQHDPIIDCAAKRALEHRKLCLIVGLLKEFRSEWGSSDISCQRACSKIAIQRRLQEQGCMRWSLSPACSY